MEEEEATIPSLSLVELAQPSLVRQDSETPAPKTSSLLKQQTRSKSRTACYVILSILEPQTNDNSEQEGSLTGSIAIKDLAASSLAL